MARYTDRLADADISVQASTGREVHPYKVVCTCSGLDPSFTDPERRVRYFPTKDAAREFAQTLAERLGLVLYSKIFRS